METVLTSENFNSFIQSDSLQVVDFWATWCGPCKMIAPILSEIAEETGLSLGKVNVDEQRALALQYRIQYIPTLIFFKNGKELTRFSGFRDKNELLNMINQYS